MPKIDDLVPHITSYAWEQNSAYRFVGIIKHLVFEVFYYPDIEQKISAALTVF